MLPRTRRLLDGPPIALPPALDAVAERWSSARPRARVATGFAAVVLVLIAGTTHAASSPYGPPVRVWVSERDLNVGELITTADVRAVDWPRDLAPDGILAEPAGTLLAPLPRGAVVTDRHVGDGGIGAVLPDNTVAVAVAHERLPELAVGMHLDLIDADPAGVTRTVAEAAVVVALDASAIWIAVRPDAAEAVAGASLTGTLGAVVLPP